MFDHLVLSVPMMVCFFWSIFFLIRLINGDGEPRVGRTIVLFFVAATVLYFDHWLYFSGVVRTAGEWSYGVVNLCVYPLYYAYLLALTRRYIRWEVMVLLLPALMAVLLFPIGRYTDWLSDADTFLIIRLCFTVQVVWVLVRGYRLLRHTIRRMDDTYSDDRSRLLRPTRLLLVLFGMTSAVSMVLNFVGRDFFAQDSSVALPAIVMSLLLYGLGYVAAHTVIPAETVGEEAVGDGLRVTEEEQKNLIHQIDNAMREKMLYTRPDLTILDLATAVGSNRTYVSNAINRTYSISFSQYVARQRVAYAQLILRDERYKTDKAAVTDAIALSGFASDQTFYRVFKEISGTTPLQFRHQKQ